MPPVASYGDWAQDITEEEEPDGVQEQRREDEPNGCGLVFKVDPDPAEDATTRAAGLRVAAIRAKV